MKKQLLFIIALLPMAISAAKLTINVAKEGTLEEVINSQSVSNITELTITGRLTAPDIAYLRQCDGRIASLSVLNLKDVTLVPSDEPYLIDNGFAFFISNEEKFVAAKSDPNATPVSYRGMFVRSRAVGPFLAKAAEGETFNPDKYNCYYGKGLPAAFQWSPLEKVILPKEVKKVGMWTFANSNLLESVEVPGGLTSIADNAFKGNVMLENINLSAVTEIGSEAFSGCTGLTEVNLNSLQTIGESAFAGCSGITGIMELPRLKKISHHAFGGCSGITEAKLSGVNTIGDMAFFGCTSLAKITLYNGLDSIGRASFFGTNMKNVSFPASLSYIGSGAFYQVPLETASFAKSRDSLIIDSPTGNKLGKINYSVNIVGDEMTFELSSGFNYEDRYGAFEVTRLAKVDLPEGLTDIGEGSFKGCAKLKIVSFPSTLKRIGVIYKDNLNADYNMRGYGAFERTGLTTITLPNSIEEIGNKTFYGCYQLVSANLPISIREIGDGAFYYCGSLASVSIPNSIQYIGSYVFSETKWAKEQKPGADGVLYYGPIAHQMTLSSVPDGTTIKIKEGTISIDFAFISEVSVGNNVTLELPSTLKNINEWAFRGSDISKVLFNEGLTRISWYAFGDCTKLKSADLPASLKYIGKNAFYNCTSLTKITIPENVEELEGGSWGDYAPFKNSGIAQLTIRARHLKDNAKIGSLPSLTRIVVGSEVEVLPADLVTGSADLLRVVFEDRPTDSRLFVGKNWCPYSHLSSFTLPDCQLEIDQQAFSGNKSCSIEVLGTVVKMEPGAFTGSGLKGSVRLGGGITEIPGVAFSGCSGLTEINIPNSVNSIGDCAFQSCTGLTSITIPNSVTTIGRQAFQYCVGLTSIAIPNSITSIENQTFDYCTGLTSVIISNSVTTIKGRAFYDCRGLTSITIPGSVTTIDYEAFSGCTAIEEVRSMIKEPFAIGGIFYSQIYSRATLYVPRGTKAKYQTADGWKNFTNIIETDFNDKPQGDLTGDEIVNGTDMVALVNVIMNGGNNPSADVNNDGQVNGTDMVALVNIIMKNDNARELMALGGEDETPAAARSEDERISFANSGVIIGAEPIRTNGDGSRELTITMTNPQMDVTMVQMDVTLPEGLTLPIDDSTDMMAGRTSWQTHQIYSAASDDGRNVRLMLASGRNALIEGTEGGIIRLTLKADDTFTGGDIVLHDMLCTSPDLEEARPADVVVCVSEATGISDASLLNNNEQRTNGRTVYNLNGQRLDAQRKGVNIVNGRKVIR